jgi:hypothetical protein
MAIFGNQLVNVNNSLGKMERVDPFHLGLCLGGWYWTETFLSQSEMLCSIV